MAHHDHDQKKKKTTAPRTREVDPKAQPDEKFRKASTDEERSREEHAFSTESHRFSDPGDSREARGYPKEGGLPPRR